MSYFICLKCYATRKEKTATCPNCGSADSFVPLDQFSPQSPIGVHTPIGEGTGGIMPENVEQQLPKLPILPSQKREGTKNAQSEKKTKRRRTRMIRG